jgi:hypothetical protein
MVIMKIPCEKISHQPRDEEEEEDAAFGFIDNRNRFKLRDDEVNQFQKHFEPFYLNRIQFLGKEANLKKTTNKNHFSFHPQLNKNSVNLAKNYKKRIAESI